MSTGCSVVRLVLVLCAVLASSRGNNMGPECSSLKNVQVYYKNYFDLYLGENAFSVGLNEQGIFVLILKEATKLCCSNAKLDFHLVPQTPATDKEVEELVFEALREQFTNPNSSVLKFFYPEFASKKQLQVYDTLTPFVRLGRSPGPAIVMVTPEPKKPVFVGEIFLKSWAIIIFLITFAWIVGVIVWMADHHYNPKDFPSPFYVGMFEGFWWSVVTMTTVGYGDKAPKGAIARALAIVWIMISTVSLSLFTANASSILAISQFEEDHTNTLGRKIGCFNSKHFYDVELNFGAQIIGFSTLFSLMASPQIGITNRLIFPNYLDFIYLRTLPQNTILREQYILTNTVDYPFQIGMTYAVNSRNITPMQDSFLRCLRSELPSLEKKTRRAMFDLSQIKSEKSLKEKIKVPLDSDSLLSTTYWFLAIIACLMALGLSWDFWMYWKRTRLHGQHDHGPGEGNIEMTQVSQPPTEGGYYPAGEDVHSGSSMTNVQNWGDPQEYKMSITGSIVPPPPPAPPPPR